MIWKKFREERANCITMKFVKSLFLAVVCTCFIMHDAFGWPSHCGMDLSGYYYWDAGAEGAAIYCYNAKCPPGCVCPDPTYVSKNANRATQFCVQRTTDIFENDENKCDYQGGYWYCTTKGGQKIYRCPANYPFTDEGETLLTKCFTVDVTCRAGYYGEEGTGNCDQLCQKGYACCYGKSGAGCNLSATKTYDRVYVGTQLSEGMELCKAGTCAALNTTRCIGGDAKGAVWCLKCPEGTAAREDGQTTCDACGKGTCSSTNGVTCVKSDENDTSSAVTGAKACITCPSGYYSDGESNSYCKYCDGKIIRTNGLPTGCKTCPAGTYSDDGECKDCHAGSYCPGDGKEYECETGTWSTAGSASCETCIGGITGEAKNKCDSCPSGQIANKDHTGCIDCDGFIAEDGECVSACEDTKDDSGHIIIARYIDGSYCRTCPAFNNKKPDGTGTFDIGKRYNREGISSCMYMYETSNCKFYYKYDDTVSKYVLGSGGYPPWSDENYYVKITSGVASGQTPTCVKCPESKPFSDEGTGGIEKCHVCEAGSCISGNSCKKCSAGYICPGDSSGNATNCGNGNDFGEYYGEEICPVNSFSNAGATKCTYCAANYTTIGSEGLCSSRSDGRGCGSSLACQMKKTSLCYLNADDKNSCKAWPSCIIEGKIDKSVLKQQTTN